VNEKPSDPRVAWNQQNPRPRTRRWILAVAMAALVVLAGYFFLGGLFQPKRVYAGGCFCQIYNEVWFSSVQSAANGKNDWYNLTVLGLNTTVPIGDIIPQIENASGAIVIPNSWSFLVVRPGSSTPLAEFNWTKYTWGAGSSTTLLTHDFFSIDVGLNNVAGYSLVFFGQGAVSLTERFPLN
jgi:hypothetical protein